MTPEKVYAQSEPVAITLPMRQWTRVLHWIQYASDYHNCKKAEYLANCKDKRMCAQMVAVHETEAAEAEQIYKSIETAIYPAPPTETE